MKTKIIPFDAKMAKDIQDGKIEGKIKQQHGEEVEILCWDLENPAGNSLAVKHKYFDECCDDCGIHVDEYNAKGEYWDRSDSMAHNDLVLEVPDDKLQFKPFDKVLVRKEGGVWCCAFFSHMDYSLVTPTVITTNDNAYKYCILYEGNEHLLGTTDKPKEE